MRRIRRNGQVLPSVVRNLQNNLLIALRDKQFILALFSVVISKISLQKVILQNVIFFSNLLFGKEDKRSVRG